MIHDDQSSSRMLSRAETDAINSILDEEEIRIGQFSSLTPNLSALDEQCKQIWSNWESIPASSTKAYSNNNNNNNFDSSPRISPSSRPTAQFDIYGNVPKRTEKFKISTPTNNNKYNDFDDHQKFGEKPKSSKYDDMFSQDFASPTSQPRSAFTSKFETTNRPPPTIDDISDFSTKPVFTQRSPNYQETLSKDPFSFRTSLDSNSTIRNQAEFDYTIPSRTSIKSDLLENDVGNLKNELNSLMAKVRTASRSPPSVNLSKMSPQSDPFSIPTKERYQQQPTSTFSRVQPTPKFDDFTSPSFQMPKPASYNQQDKFTSPKTSYASPSANDFVSTSPKIGANKYTQKIYDSGMNDDSILPHESISLNDDDNTFVEPTNISPKVLNESKFTHNVPPTVSNPTANQSSPSQPEILLLRQENVRLKAELLKAQKQLQAEREEKENIKLSLVKCEQLRQRYKERLKMYEKQMGLPQQPQQNK